MKRFFGFLLICCGVMVSNTVFAGNATPQDLLKLLGDAKCMYGAAKTTCEIARVKTMLRDNPQLVNSKMPSELLGTQEWLGWITSDCWSNNTDNRYMTAEAFLQAGFDPNVRMTIRGKTANLLDKLEDDTYVNNNTTQVINKGPIQPYRDRCIKMFKLLEKYGAKRDPNYNNSLLPGNQTKPVAPTPCVAENAAEAFMENDTCVIKKCNTGFDEVTHGGKITGCMTPCSEYYKRDILDDKCKKDKCTPDDLAAIGAEEGKWLGEKVGCMATACKDKSITPDKLGKCNKTSGTATKHAESKKTTQTPQAETPAESAKPTPCTSDELAKLHATRAVRMPDGTCSPTQCDSTNGYELGEGATCIQAAPQVTQTETKPETNTKTEDKKTETTNTTTTKWIVWFHIDDKRTDKKEYDRTNGAGLTINLSTQPTRQGYTFQGWFKDADFKTSAHPKNDLDKTDFNKVSLAKDDSSDITLYAKWEPTQYKITYICDTTNMTQCSECRAVYRDIEKGNIKLTCKPEEKTGFNFIGWYDSANKGKLIESIPANTYKNVTVYAGWQRQGAITVNGIVYDENDQPAPFTTIKAVDEKKVTLNNAKGTAIQAQTDEAGKFTLNDVPTTAQIHVTLMGYKEQLLLPTRQMTINLKKRINVLAEHTSGMIKYPAPRDCESKEKHIKKGRLIFTSEADKDFKRLNEQYSTEPDENNKNQVNYQQIAEQMEKIKTDNNSYFCEPIECMDGFGEKITDMENGTFVNKPIRNSDGVLECPKQKPACPAGSVECRDIYSSRAPTIFEKINPVLGAHFAANSSSVWKNDQGKFNTARLASDSIAATVLGTVGGVVTSTVMKKNQVKKGFENIKCTVGGQNVSDYGDEFRVGLWTTTQQPQYK